MAEVVFKDATKVYEGGIVGAQSINLTVRDEEFIVLVGPSGCGKSTTLRMVAGLEDVTSGTIHIGNRMINNVQPKDRDIAMVFQSYALYPHMTVYNNMAFGLKLRKYPKEKIKQSVANAAKILGISELLNRKPKALSGGQRQRVALGRAIVREPKAFLFDEPLSNLDAKLRVETRAELKALHRRLHTTTIYVTHDQEEAMTLGDRIVVMFKGIIQQCATPLEVYDRPVNRFVAGFVGTPPMNFLEGKLNSSDGSVWWDGFGAKVKLPEAYNQYLVDRVGKDVVLGIRPEHMSSRCEGRFADSDNVLSVDVSVVEILGDKKDVHMKIGGDKPLVSRVDAHEEISEASQMRMYLDTDKLHIFEPGETGVNMCVSKEAAGASA